ncbi:MAG: XTP/dITP diphosphatase [Lachnospiraceae bacterium]|nr:XTP/dITP diphosphatase [Lachnospiraceae bacterium]
MAKRIVFATGNEGKMREIREILGDLDIEIISMKEAGVNPDIVEDGTTYEENAMIKARAVAKLLPEDIVMADDSGLEVDYMDKAPGIYSSRFMGVDTPYSEKNAEILKRLKGVPDEKRTARFVCAIACVLPSGEERHVRGVIEGRIDYEIRGVNGFGYDPIFYVPEYGRTTAELSEEEKNRISHRGRALALMKEELGDI